MLANNGITYSVVFNSVFRNFTNFNDKDFYKKVEEQINI